MNKKDDIKSIIFIGIFIIVFIYLLIKAFTPTEEDKQAYNRCLNIYNNDAKLCNKLIHGVY